MSLASPIMNCIHYGPTYDQFNNPVSALFTVGFNLEDLRQNLKKKKEIHINH